ncbi:response regulator transcription factor [Cyclobacterium plantarum]|nr:helix-turn-helix transcriptional regulator [Cyclobacterium plantarum]
MSSKNGIIPSFSGILSNEEIHALTDCSSEGKYLMVSVFDLGKKKFLFHNDSFKNILGYSSEVMEKGGWEFWFQKIKPMELSGIRQLIESLISNPDCLNHIPPRNSYTYHIQDIFQKWYLIQHQVSLLIKSNNDLIISYLYNITHKERIEKVFSGFQLWSQNRNIEISNREREVLHLIGEGFSSKQIADKLYISIHTAISHRKHLIEKFAVKNTAQLIKEASKSDMI